MMMIIVKLSLHRFNSFPLLEISLCNIILIIKIEYIKFRQIEIIEGKTQNYHLTFYIDMITSNRFYRLNNKCDKCVLVL